MFLLLLALAASPQKRPVELSALPAELRQLNLAAIEQRAAERLRLGEGEHLVYFLLQSQRFTREPRIEPARSAREFVEDKEAIPQAVSRRIGDFLAAIRKPAADARLSYFQSWLGDDRTPKRVQAEYGRAMRFLYAKEFGSKDAALYQQRGHSTDTQVEANFAVWTALSVLKALNPTVEIDRVLIVGPGLDFAPRTELFDALEPQSYQPVAVADALVELRLARPDRLRIHCVDINDRVIQHLREFPKRRQLILSPGRPNLSADYRAWLEKLGRSIGTRSGARLSVRREVAEKISAERMNILTERYDPSPGYDLVVATNVLIYFDRSELALALSSIASMLGPGGYLVHNELRAEAEAFGRTMGLAPIQARSIQITTGPGRPLMDAFVIQRK